MVYTPIAWVGSTYTGVTPTAVCTSNLNHFETQYTEAVAYSTTYYAPIASPAFTGEIYFGTWTVGECSTKVANTFFVQRRVQKVKSDLAVTGKWTTAL